MVIEDHGPSFLFMEETPGVVPALLGTDAPPLILVHLLEDPSPWFESPISLPCH